jgi:hypothetical protein
MRGTFTLPNGAKVRTATQRRYVLLVCQFRDDVSIERRSDSLATVEAEFNRHLNTARSGDSAIRTRWFILDTVTGEILRQRSEEDFIWVD